MRTEKLLQYLSEKTGAAVELAEFRQLSGGACQDNYLTRIKAAGKEQALVLRTDKGGSLLGSLTRPQEFQVIERAVAAGVLTPGVKWLSEDASIVGHPFYLMQKIEGTANARDILKSKKIDFKRLAADVAVNLAKIHSIEYSPAILPFLDRGLRPGTNDVALTAVADCRRLLDELPGGYPAIELCLNWAEANAPVTDKIVLAHSDFRTGNFMVSSGQHTPEGGALSGVLDWEFAHWSDRHEDIGYIRMRDWRFGKVKNEIGGFASAEDFYPHYEAAAGTKIDTDKVRYWEVMGNLRWAIGAAQQGERHLSGKDKGIEYASIGRRVAEMEFEAMRLIES
ncbi:MAG: phosphotransferase family protein [Leptospiraceae bacterium]|nr:phosphotransferase family protein [Leptospiraceae bacterium]